MATIEQTEPDYTYENFIGRHVQASKPKDKTFEGEGGGGKYKELPLLYNHGTEQAPVIDSCLMELPIVECKGGIVSKSEKKKARKEGDPPYIKESHSLMFTFDMQDNDIKACLLKMDELHSGCAHAFAKFKNDLGQFKFDPENPGQSFKPPVFYKMDVVSGEKTGQNPTMWVKLNHWKNNKTLFTDLNGNSIDWSLLYDVDLKMIPLVHVDHIYVGSNSTTIQMKLVSAVITDIVSMNTRTKQGSTLNRLKQKYAGLADTVASQLATLRMEKQDSLDDGNFQPQNATLPGSGVGQMHQIPSGSTAGGTQGNVDQLNDFLGGAPAVSQSPPVQQPSQAVPSQAPIQQAVPSQQVYAQQSQAPPQAVPSQQVYTPQQAVPSPQQTLQIPTQVVPPVQQIQMPTQAAPQQAVPQTQPMLQIQ